MYYVYGSDLLWSPKEDHISVDHGECVCLLFFLGVATDNKSKFNTSIDHMM